MFVGWNSEFWELNISYFIRYSKEKKTQGNIFRNWRTWSLYFASLSPTGRREGERLNPVVETPKESVDIPKMNFSMNFKSSAGEKRKSTEYEAEPTAKKISIGFNMKNTPATDVDASDGAKKPVAPIKMSLGVQVSSDRYFIQEWWNLQVYIVVKPGQIKSTVFYRGQYLVF